MTSSSGCLSDNQWWIMVATSAGIFVCGLIILGLIRLLTRYTTVQARARETSVGRAYTTLKGVCEGWISGSTIIGRVVISVSCLFSIGSLAIYIVDATRLPDAVECESLKESETQQVDLAFNIFFLLHFMLRFVAANDKLMFWVELNSLVDMFTVPPVFLSAILDKQWLGFRFLRAFRLINIPDLLQYLRLLRTSNAIRLSQLICILLSVWLAAAGFVHLVENTGGLTHDLDMMQNITYWESAYFIIITLSTVGYGDYSCKTTLGQAFIVIFILTALAMFASFIPEIAEIFGKQKRFKGSFETRAGFGHVVLCGHITFDSVDNFLRDFHHKDRGNRAVRSVFLHNAMPDLELEALLKRHFTNVTYLRGMVTNPRDLNRVKLKDAEACLIMANPQATDPDSEDAANIMRLISVKNYDQRIRVIVQLIGYKNKAFCISLPFWTSYDQVICLSEMKLGFMAGGILAPGFSTLMANLFVMTSYDSSSKGQTWQNHYMRGAGMEIYSEPFSPALHGKSFSYVFEMCYRELGLLLVAVAFRTVDSNMTARSKVVLNPGSNFIIDSSVKGFFICQSEEEAKQVVYYCADCFKRSSRKQRNRPCKCRSVVRKGADTSLVSLSECSEQKKLSNDDDDHIPRLPLPEGMVTIEVSEPTSPRDFLQSPGLKSDETFETTGMFHWCPAADFEQRVLSDDDDESGSSLDNHVIVCCFADTNTSSICLRNLALPLRASNIPSSELRTIVLVGDEGFLSHQWPQICNYPKIYMKLGSPLNRSVLRSLSIGRCHMCLILSSNEVSIEDPTLCDKESILCTLNIKTMSLLPQTFTDTQRHVMAPPTSGSVTLHLPQEEESRRSGASSVAEPKNNIFMLTEIAHDSNAQYIDQDDEDDPDAPLYVTQPFCCGRTFSASVLGSLMSSIYYNPEILNLIRTLVIGGDAVEMEQLLAEGIDLDQCSMPNEELNRIRNRSRIGLLGVRSRVLKRYSEQQTYGQLVVRVERELGILCLGVYRLLSTEVYGAESHNRYVITNPPEDFQLEPNDKVFCLRPFLLAQQKPRQESESIRVISPDQATML